MTQDDKLVEAMARGAYQRFWDVPSMAQSCLGWDYEDIGERKWWRDEHRAALTALRAAGYTITGPDDNSHAELVEALEEARHFVVVSGVTHISGIIGIIDVALAKATGGQHVCSRCGEPNPHHIQMDGCRDPDCPENRQ